MKKVLYTLLLCVWIGFPVLAGSITVFSPADGSTYYAPPGNSSLSIFFHIGGSGSGYPYVNIYKFVVKLDGNTVFDSPNYYPDFWATAYGLGTHSVYVEMWEEDYIGRRFLTTTKTTSFTLKPTYNIIVKNDFDGGKLRTTLDGITTDWNNTTASGITLPVGKDKTLTITAFDDQIGSDGLLRKWKQWVSNNSVVTTNLSTDQIIISEKTFEATFNKQPSTPTNFSVGTQNGIQLTWTAISDPVEYYEVWRKVNNNDFVLHSTTTGASFVDPDFAVGGNINLSYKIRAKGTNGLFSNYTNIVSVSNAAPYKHGTDIIQLSGTPTVFELHQNYPNPFNPTTEISYSVPEPSFVTLVVYNALGQKIAILVKEYKSVGNYSVTWNASGLPSGVYFYSFKAEKYSSLKKMVLAK